MKYLSLKSVSSAYDGCYGNTKIQFWSLVAILRVINETIIPARSYTFVGGDVSVILDNLFSFGQKSNSEKEQIWSILFSNIWKEYMFTNFIKNSPNIYDVAVWLLRKDEFDDNINQERLLSVFLNKIHLRKEELEPYFNFNNKEIHFEDFLYDDKLLKEDLSINHGVIFQSKIKGEKEQPEKNTLIFDDKKCIQYAAGNFTQAYVQTLYAAQKIQQCVILTKFDFNSLYKNESECSNKNMEERQIIYYGAPGTGKSHEIKKAIKGKSVIRTTFHPDSDYSTFVGCYKPFVGTGRVYGAQGPLTENGKPIEEPKITYRYVMQAFLKAYLGAWKKYADRNDDICEPQFLVIEEINRGNCAQIFGDLFQLLDRGENKFSEYPIEADTDLQQEIERAFKEEGDYKLAKDIDVDGIIEDYRSNYNATISEDIQHGRVLLLPSNLYIWATMNTSDQSLFPIDSAFKRRWDWEYMPIGYKNDNWIIEIGEKKYKWVDFQHKINEAIYSTDNSEDKQLGDYFVNADRTGNKISAETLLNKIFFYLWNDVCKDDPDQIFKWVDDGDNKEKSIKFSEFFCGEDERNRKLQGFMAFLKVIAIGESQARTSEPSQSTEEAETNDATAEIMK